MLNTSKLTRVTLKILGKYKGKLGEIAIRESERTGDRLYREGEIFQSQSSASRESLPISNDLLVRSMMDDGMKCPKCSSEHAYQDRGLWVCAECAHEWSAENSGMAETSREPSVRDAHGNVLSDGDSVIVIKDLKVKGSSSVVKGGTKVKNVRLTEATDGHNIACKIEGIGAMNLKSEFVKKA
jgi:protein PhnA